MSLAGSAGESPDGTDHLATGREPTWSWPAPFAQAWTVTSVPIGV
jgi:hypothetical protein